MFQVDFSVDEMGIAMNLWANEPVANSRGHSPLGTIVTSDCSRQEQSLLDQRTEKSVTRLEVARAFRPGGAFLRMVRRPDFGMEPGGPGLEMRWAIAGLSCQVQGLPFKSVVRNLMPKPGASFT